MLEIAVIYLAAAIIAVPIAKRLGLGSVLGYLLAGMLIGPFALSLVGDQTDVMRFGQIIGRLLTVQGYHLSILDHSSSQIDLVRRFGNKVFYGDAASRDLLAAAGAANAQLLVIAIDRRHSYELLRLGVTTFKRETFDSAVNLGVEALALLGNSRDNAERAGKLFAAHDEESLHTLANLWGDDRSYGVAVKQRLEVLKQVLMNDKEQQEKLNTCSGGEAQQAFSQDEIATNIANKGLGDA